MKYIACILLTVFLASCAGSVGSLEDTMLNKFQSHADSIAFKLGSGLVAGMSSVALSSTSQDRMGQMLDSLLHSVGIRTSKEVAALLDTIAGETTNNRLKALLTTARRALDTLRDDALGKKTGAMLANLLQHQILGPATQVQLQNLVKDGLLGPATEQRLGEILAKLRDTLVGVQTQSSIDSIVQRSLARVQATGNEQQSFLTRNLSTILWTLGVILAALLILSAILFVHKRKADTMLKVITNQIEAIPEQQHFDALTKNISARAKVEGVEKELRVFLAQNLEGRG